MTSGLDQLASHNSPVGLSIMLLNQVTHYTLVTEYVRIAYTVQMKPWAACIRVSSPPLKRKRTGREDCYKQGISCFWCKRQTLNSHRYDHSWCSQASCDPTLPLHQFYTCQVPKHTLTPPVLDVIPCQTARDGCICKYRHSYYIIIINDILYFIIYNYN